MLKQQFFIYVFGVVLISLLLNTSSLADHHIDCNDPVNSIFPECANSTTTETDCLAVYESAEKKLYLNWVNLTSGGTITATYKNAVFELIYSTDAHYFQLREITKTEASEAPSDTDCHAAYDTGVTELTFPSVKLGHDATTADYKNIKMLLDSASEYIFKLIQIEKVTQ